MHPTTLATLDFGLVEKFISNVKPKSGDSLDLEKLTALDGPILSSFLPLRDRNNTSLVVNALDDLKTLEGSLVTLQHIAREAFSQLSLLRARIMMLPFDVLAGIFEDVISSDYDARTCLSLVCKRFNKTVLDMPQLWTVLDSKEILNPHHYLERSKSMGIDVYLDLHSSRSESFAREVVQHASRWKSFSFRGDIRSASRDTIYELSAILSKSIFPALKSLRIEYDVDYDVLTYAGRRAVDYESKEVRNMVGTWDMPVLQTARFENLVPILSATPLTSIDLTLSDEYYGNLWNLQMIADLLCSSSSLVLLSINFKCERKRRFLNEEDVSVDLPQLESLVVRITYPHLNNIVIEEEDDDIRDFRDMFCTWDTPVLQRAEFGNLVPILPATSLTCIALTLDGVTNGSLVWDLQTIADFLCSCSALEELSIHIRDLYRFSNAEGLFVDLPWLEKLVVSIVDCENECVEGLMRLLHSASNVKELHMFVKATDHTRAEEQVELFFPGDRVYWPYLETLGLINASWIDNVVGITIRPSVGRLIGRAADVRTRTRT